MFLGDCPLPTKLQQTSLSAQHRARLMCAETGASIQRSLLILLARTPPAGHASRWTKRFRPPAPLAPHPPRLTLTCDRDCRVRQHFFCAIQHIFVSDLCASQHCASKAVCPSQRTWLSRGSRPPAFLPGSPATETAECVRQSFSPTRKCVSSFMCQPGLGQNAFLPHWLVSGHTGPARTPLRPSPFGGVFVH